MSEVIHQPGDLFATVERTCYAWETTVYQQYGFGDMVRIELVRVPSGTQERAERKARRLLAKLRVKQAAIVDPYEVTE